MNRMTNLSYDQRFLLSAYRKFFGERYEKGCSQKAMQMMYLFQLVGIDAGQFHFSWNEFPYSPGLLAFLLKLEGKKSDIDLFYDIVERKDNIINMVLSQIVELRSALEIASHSTNLEVWVILLASLAYMSRSILPGMEYQKLSKELANRVSISYSDVEIRKAWDDLYKARLLILPD